MDRTNDFSKIAQVFQQHTPPSSNNSNSEVLNSFLETNRNNNKLISTSVRISSNINSNKSLLEKIKLLSSHKEFSNDPTNKLTDISNIFQTKINLIKHDLETLKNYNQSFKVGLSKHHQQHYNVMIDTLSKNLNQQIKLFQKNICIHTNNIKQRQSRIVKYGQSTESVILPSNNIEQYAMFSDNTTELRKRGTNTKSPYISNSNISQTQLQLDKNESKFIKENRLSNAKKIENSIKQMGSLFTQIATLVMEQSETISRIEDDVEIGYDQTKQANESMQKFYEISKGNRGMILKIFALLIFFIFLFLVWT